MDYNHYRPHSSLDYMAPAAFATACLEQGSAPLRLPQDRETDCEILSSQVVQKTGADHINELLFMETDLSRRIVLL